MNLDIQHNLEQIRKKIEKKAGDCGRDPSSIRLVAVSKKKPAERIREAAKAGATSFGENYIKEAVEKIEALAALNLSWHFIGHLQSNKAGHAVKHFDLIHTVDSMKLASELNRQAEKIGKVQNVLIQVNISREATKSGISQEDVTDLVKDISLLPHIAVKGLMTMPPYVEDPEEARPYFRKLRLISEEIGKKGIPDISMAELSMGMTHDFETAIEEGATLVRIGTAIFGERP